MPDFTVITENDESQWNDKTGELYHFPKRYVQYLRPGTQVLYYKGKLKNRQFRSQRHSDSPYYFAVAEIGRVWPDPRSTKGDHYAQVTKFREFRDPVLAKIGDEFIETIPESRQSNYWRDGVRPIDGITFERVLRLTDLQPVAEDGSELNDGSQGDAGLESGVEGKPHSRYVTQYERDPALRRAAIALHGTTCKVCGFNFGKFYGAIGVGFIHIHHLKPVAELGGPAEVNPATDMVPVCANCHAMIHRRRGQTLGLDDLKQAVGATIE